MVFIGVCVNYEHMLNVAQFPIVLIMMYAEKILNIYSQYQCKVGRLHILDPILLAQGQYPSSHWFILLNSLPMAKNVENYLRTNWECDILIKTFNNFHSLSGINHSLSHNEVTEKCSTPHEHMKQFFSVLQIL